MTGTREPTEPGRTPTGRLAAGGRAVALAAAFAIVVVVTLAARVPDILDVPMASTPGWPPVPVRLIETGGPAPPVYVLWLHAPDVGEVVRHAEIAISFSTFGERASLVRGTLLVIGTSCAYEASAARRVEDGDLMSFIRGPGCAAGPHAAAAMKLSVTLRSRTAIGVVGFVPPYGGSLPAEGIHVAGFAGDTPRVMLGGRFIDPTPATNTRRIDLLAYVWQLGPGPVWILSAIAGASLLLVVAVMMFPRGPLESPRGRGRLATRTALASGAAAAALGICYAVVVPPFQAADEPTHFVGFSEVTSRPALAARAEQWARVIHLERIRFATAERFRPADRDRPSTLKWHGVDPAAHQENRSATMVRIWSWLAMLPPVRASVMLLVLRLINVLLFALAVGAATWIVALSGGAPFAHLAGVMFLAIPTLPFFGMQVSNYAVLTAAYMLVAGATTALIIDGPAVEWASLPLGFGAGIAFLTSRSAVPFAVMLAFLCVARAVLGSPRARTLADAALRAAVFWTGFAVSFMAAFAFSVEQYRFYVVGTVEEHLPDWGVTIVRFATMHPYLVLMCAAVGGIVLETYCAAVRERVAAGLWARSRRIAIVCAWGLAVALAAAAVASLLVAFPTLAPVDLDNRPPIRDYVWQALRSGLLFVRFSRPDFLLTTSFWTGFGWLDVPVPAIVSTALSLATGAGLAVLAITLARRDDGRRLVRTAIVLAGAVVTLAAYAVATLVRSPDLHGRYAMGLYLIVFVQCWSAWLMVASGGRRIRGLAVAVPRELLLIAMVLLLHAVSLHYVAARYF